MAEKVNELGMTEGEYNKLLDETILEVAKEEFKNACEEKGISTFQVCAIDPSTPDGLAQLTAAAMQT